VKDDVAKKKRGMADNTTPLRKKNPRRGAGVILMDEKGKIATAKIEEWNKRRKRSDAQHSTTGKNNTSFSYLRNAYRVGEKGHKSN